MPRYPLPSISPQEVAALEGDYRRDPNPLVRRRAQIVVLVYSLPNQNAVAAAVRCSLDTVQRTMALFRRGGRSALRPRPRHMPASVRKMDLAWQKALAEAMAAGPEACSVPRPTWTGPLLAEYLRQHTGVEVGERSVRRALVALGYVCRRPTWTVKHKAEALPNYLPKGKGSKRS